MRTAAERICSSIPELKTDPNSLTPAEAAALADDLAVVEKAVAAVRLRLVVRAEEGHEWRKAGDRSVEDWASRQTGRPVGQVGAELEAVRQLGAFPQTAAALGEGTVSASQAAAIVSAAKVDPAAEEKLLDLAPRSTVKRFHEEATRLRAAGLDAAQQAAAIRRRRSCRMGATADGGAFLELRGPKAEILGVHAAITGRADRAFKAAGKPAPGAEVPTYDNRLFDAAVAVLRGGAGGACSGGAVAGEAEGTVGEGAKAQAKLIVVVDHTALTRGATVAGETCEVAGIGPVPVAAVEELLATGDIFYTAVIKRGHDVVNVAHLGRGPNAYQRTALEAVGGTECTNSLCNRTLGIQVDHRVPFVANPETALPNLDPLCPDCHRRKTHHGWLLEPGTGRRPLRPPDHPNHPNHGGAGGPAVAGTRPAAGDAGEVGDAPVEASGSVGPPGSGGQVGLFDGGADPPGAEP